MLSSKQIIEKTNHYGAHNYAPKPVVIVKAEGAVVTDPEGRQYYDMLSAYSAHNFGHRHPEIVAAAKAQLQAFIRHLRGGKGVLCWPQPSRRRVVWASLW